MFKLFKKEEDKEQGTTTVHNRLLEIRIGREYARGDDMNGNEYECLKMTAEEVYERSIESSDDLKNVKKEYFVEGYNAQAKELALVLN